MTRIKKQAFTLIELLVVIAIIALLLSILTPSLKRVKEIGRRAVCLANLKSLTLSWTLYAEDNEGEISSCVATGFYGVDNGWVGAVEDPYKFTPIEAPVELQLEAIRNGVLYPYNEADGIYHCLVAKSEEVRTYSCSPGMRGRPNSNPPQFIRKVSQISNTGSRIVFLDDYGNNYDAIWAIPRDKAKWHNPIPMRHGKGTTLSFSDAHAEWWDWEDQRTIEWASKDWEEAEAARLSMDEQPDNVDLVRIQRGIYSKLDY